MQPSVDPFLAAKTVARRELPARWRSGRTTAAGCVFLATRLSALPTSRPPVRLIYRLCRASLVYARGVVEKELGPLCIASPLPRPPSFAALSPSLPPVTTTLFLLSPLRLTDRASEMRALHTHFLFGTCPATHIPRRRLTRAPSHRKLCRSYSAPTLSSQHSATVY